VGGNLWFSRDGGLDDTRLSGCNLRRVGAAFSPMFLVTILFKPDFSGVLTSGFFPVGLTIFIMAL
jgi:hypothetical protein